MKSKIEIMSREAMTALIESGFPENTAVISFYNPPRPGTKAKWKSNGPVDFRGICDRVFPVEIHDIDLEVLEDFGLTFETYFPEAPELARFIYSATEDGMNIICQCEYGQSRSAACAAAIYEHFDRSGIEIFSDYRYYPNQLVYNKLKEALDREGLSHTALKGPFWVNTDERRVLAYAVSQKISPVPSHKEAWELLSTPKHRWNYYPRGRVEIRRDKAVVFAHPLCFEFEELEGYLRFFFHLRDLPIEYKTDNSRHYTNGLFKEAE